MRLSSLSSPSPMLRTAGLLAASDIAPALVVDIDEDGVSMRLIEGFEEVEHREAPLAHAVMLCLETWYFQILVLIAGLLKDPELALASLSVW